SGALGEIVGRLSSEAASRRRDKVIAQMRADIERLRKDRVVYGSQIRSRFPEYAELVDPRPVGLAEVWAVLSPGEAFVSVFVGERETYVWVVPQEGAREFYVAPVGRGALDAE